VAHSGPGFDTQPGRHFELSTGIDQASAVMSCSLISPERVQERRRGGGVNLK
jgi:hypothetical protein